MRITLLVVVLALALLMAACGGDDSSEQPTVPADIAAWVRSIGGDPDTTLTTITPGQVYRTPSGYSLGYCGAAPGLTNTVTANLCTDTATP